MIRLLVLLLAMPAAASAQDRVLGLLRLPEVFGNGPCAPFEPRVVTLHAEPGGKPVATIQVDRNWSFAPHGGCEGLQVSVHQGDARTELPIREYDYEAPAAIVLEQRGPWFRIRMGGGASAWVETPLAERFLSFESLLEEFASVTFIADGFAGALASAPAGTVAGGSGARVTPGRPVRVIESRTLAERTWLHVEILSHSICDAAAGGPPEATAHGWLPAHADSGETTVWFSSRGC